MEIFNPNKLNVNTFRSVISQNGRGAGIDRYIYNQSGEGIASFFGNLVKSAIPLFGSAIKGAAAVATPHIKSAAKDLITAGSKRVIEHISGDTVRKTKVPKRKRRRRY